MVLEAADSAFSSGRSGLVTFKAGASFPFFTAFQP
jgi:hypothetical protein